MPDIFETLAAKPATRHKLAAGETLFRAGDRVKTRVAGWLVFVSAMAIFGAGCTEKPRADPENAEQVALGKRLYEVSCAACHGAKLEGQPNWRERLPTGRLPAPPHDASGHTWHHPDDVLFGITKQGVGPYAGNEYLSDMPAFAGQLSDDEIWAVLAYIKSTWSGEIRAMQAEVTRDSPRRQR